MNMMHFDSKQLNVKQRDNTAIMVLIFSSNKLTRHDHDYNLNINKAKSTYQNVKTKVNIAHPRTLKHCCEVYPDKVIVTQCI